jgi:23S rRNA pseudouridine1911/1915/1917 synthase
MRDTHTLTVDADTAGQRLDKFLARQLPDISRARLQALIEGGAVVRRKPSPLGGEGLDEGTADSARAHPLPLTQPSPPKRGEGFPPEQASHSPITSSTYKVRADETYTLTIPDIVALDLTPATNITLDIVYEDADIIILNKPAGMTVHPAAGTHGDTLVHALIHHCGSSLSGIGGVARPGIVHRIDKETSGLLAVAKNDAAHAHLSAQLKERSLTRTYIAYVWSALTPREGSIDAPIARNPRDRKAMAVVAGGKHAITHYETLASYHIPGNITALASKVLCELETGRTHQIRVHMNHAKCPLIGDPVYGLKTSQRLQRLKASGYLLTPEALSFFENFRRQALHALGLRLIHPKTEEVMEFKIPLAPDLVALENTLAVLTIKG